MKYNQHLLFNDTLLLYNAVQFKPFTKIQLPRQFEPLVSMIEEVFGEEFVNYVDGFEQGYVQESKRVGVAFSGGRDSAALSYKLRELGYEVTLFHSVGANPAYADEAGYTERFGKKYGFGVAFMKHPVRVVKGAYIENVAKNFLLMAQVLHQGKPLGVSGVGLGSEAVFGRSLLDYGFSDSFTSIERYGEVVRDLLGAGYHAGLFERESDTYTYLNSKGVDFRDVVSCMTPVRYRGKLNRINLGKGYSVRFDGCGSCFKCALDYYYLSRLGVLEQSEKGDVYYFGVLKRHWMHMYDVEPESNGKFLDGLINRNYVNVEELKQAVGKTINLESW